MRSACILVLGFAAAGLASGQAGLQRAEFVVPEGKVRVNLPDDMRAGDRISGTVYLEPAGRTEAERQRNLGRLQGYVIDAGGDRQPARERRLRAYLPLATFGLLDVSLLTSSGKPLNTASLRAAAPSTAPLGGTGPLIPEPLNPGTSPIARPPASAKPGPAPLENPGPLTPDPLNPGVKTEVPPVAQAGRPLPVTGAFDGDAGNTRVSIGGQPAEVLAESPRQTVLLVPPSLSGPSTVQVQDTPSAAPATANTQVVSVALSAPRTGLLRGEQTTLTMTVSGLSGLTQPVPLELTNNTPQVVQLEGGNTQGLTIAPSQVPGAGQFTFTRTLTGVQPGNFDLEGGVVFQANPNPGKEDPCKSKESWDCRQRVEKIQQLWQTLAVNQGMMDYADELARQGVGSAGVARMFRPDPQRCTALWKQFYPLFQVILGHDVPASADAARKAGPIMVQAAFCDPNPKEQGMARDLQAAMKDVKDIDPSAQGAAADDTRKKNQQVLDKVRQQIEAKDRQALSHAIAKILTDCERLLKDCWQLGYVKKIQAALGGK